MGPIKINVKLSTQLKIVTRLCNFFFFFRGQSMSVFVLVFVLNIENADIFMPSPDYNFIKWWEVGNGLGLQQLEALLKMVRTYQRRRG